MIVRVIMTRKMARYGRGLDVSLLPILSELLVELRSIANRQAGYISGETLRNVNNPEEYVVISTWRSLEDWRDGSPTRKGPNSRARWTPSSVHRPFIKSTVITDRAPKGLGVVPGCIRLRLWHTNARADAPALAP